MEYHWLALVPRACCVKREGGTINVFIGSKLACMKLPGVIRHLFSAHFPHILVLLGFNHPSIWSPNQNFTHTQSQITKKPKEASRPKRNLRPVVQEGQFPGHNPCLRSKESQVVCHLWGQGSHHLGLKILTPLFCGLGLETSVFLSLTKTLNIWPKDPLLWEVFPSHPILHLLQKGKAPHPPKCVSSVL